MFTLWESISVEPLYFIAAFYGIPESHVKKLSKRLRDTNWIVMFPSFMDILGVCPMIDIRIGKDGVLLLTLVRR